VQTKNALCLHAYALTQPAARTLLAQNTPMTIAVDEYIRGELRKNTLKAYAKSPQQFLQQNPHVESAISSVLKHEHMPQCTETMLLPLAGLILFIILVVALGVTLSCRYRRK
jgi:hypothetical protein